MSLLDRIISASPLILLPPPQIGLTKDTLFVDIFDNTTIDKIALFVSESSLKRDKGSEGETPNH